MRAPKPSPMPPVLTGPAAGTTPRLSRNSGGRHLPSRHCSAPRHGCAAPHATSAQAPPRHTRESSHAETCAQSSSGSRHAPSRHTSPRAAEHSASDRHVVTPHAPSRQTCFAPQRTPSQPPSRTQRFASSHRSPAPHSEAVEQPTTRHTASRQTRPGVQRTPAQGSIAQRPPTHASVGRQVSPDALDEHDTIRHAPPRHRSPAAHETPTHARSTHETPSHTLPSPHAVSPQLCERQRPSAQRWPSGQTIPSHSAGACNGAVWGQPVSDRTAPMRSARRSSEFTATFRSGSPRAGATARGDASRSPLPRHLR